MRKKCSWLMVVLCCVLMMHTTPVMAAGAQDDSRVTVMPRAVYIAVASIDMQISNGTAYISADLSGHTDVTKVTIKAELQRKKDGSWKTIKTFTKSKNSRVVVMEEEYPVDSETYTYRVKATFTAYSGSSSESRIGYSAEI